jgi:hypothetical protein
MFTRAYSRPQLKPTRNRRRPATRFGAGLLAWTPSFPETHNVEDERWYVEHISAGENDAYDRLLDQMAGAFETQGRLDAGLAIC